MTRHSHHYLISSLHYFQQYNCGWYFGAVIAAWATFGTRNYEGSWVWRVPSLLQVLLPLVGIPGLIMIPDSPRWLVSVDRIDEARKNLADLHAGGDLKSLLIEFEMAEIQQTIQAEKEAEQHSAWTDLGATPGNRHRLFISISLGTFAQWSGNGVVSYYLSIILKSVGITSVDDQTLISACLQIWNLIWAVTAAMLVDRLGRRMLFMTSVSHLLLRYGSATNLFRPSSCWFHTLSSQDCLATLLLLAMQPLDLPLYLSSSCKSMRTLSFACVRASLTINTSQLLLRLRHRSHPSRRLLPHGDLALQAARQGPRPRPNDLADLHLLQHFRKSDRA
jgi:MFS family permease